MRVSFESQNLIDLLNLLNIESDRYYYIVEDSEYDPSYLFEIQTKDRRTDIIISVRMITSADDFLIYLLRELRYIKGRSKNELA